MKKRWEIELNNDVGHNDECYVEWWEVIDTTNLHKPFKCGSKTDAEWLCELLNKLT